jgi:predicted DNA-binding protein
MKNKTHIAEAIDLLRDEQPFEGAIGLLSELYNSTSEYEIRKSVEAFMNDIKDQSAAPEVIQEIMHGWKPETTKMLVASCWQSGLDYSTYTREITEVFFNSDFATALECFTVMEESVQTLKPEEKKELLEYIENKSLLLKPEMSGLALELKSILSQG